MSPSNLAVSQATSLSSPEINLMYEKALEKLLISGVLIGYRVFPQKEYPVIGKLIPPRILIKHNPEVIFCSLGLQTTIKSFSLDPVFTVTNLYSKTKYLGLRRIVCKSYLINSKFIIFMLSYDHIKEVFGKNFHYSHDPSLTNLGV